MGALGTWNLAVPSTLDPDTHGIYIWHSDGEAGLLGDWRIEGFRAGMPNACHGMHPPAPARLPHTLPFESNGHAALHF